MAPTPLLMSDCRSLVSVTLPAVPDPLLITWIAYVSTSPAGAIGRFTDCMRRKSAELPLLLAVTVWTLELFAGLGSATFGLMVVSTPLFVLVPGLFAVAVRTMSGSVVPDVSGAPDVTTRLQMMFDGLVTGTAEQVQPMADRLVTVTPAGRSSVTLTVPLNVPGPALRAVSVQLNGTPMTTSAGLGPLFVRLRSAPGSCSVAPPSVAVLFAAIGSTGTPLT